MITNDICKSCQLCCLGVLTQNGYCPNLSSTGCIGKWEDRDEGCQAYPFIIVQDDRSVVKRRIFIDTACPHWKLFAEQENEIKKSNIGPTIFLRTS